MTEMFLWERLVSLSLHKLEILLALKIGINKDVNGDDFNLVSEVSEVGTIQLEDATSSDYRDFLLFERMVLNWVQQSTIFRKQFLIRRIYSKSGLWCDTN